MAYFLSFFQNQNAPPIQRQRRRSLPQAEGVPNLQEVPDAFDLSKMFGKIMKFGQKTVGSITKLSEHPLAIKTADHLKKWGDRVAGILIFNEIYSGRIQFSSIQQVIGKIFSKEVPTDEELGILMAIITLDEVLGKECNVSVQKKIFDALKISFHDHVDTYRNWMKMRQFVRSNLSEVVKGLTSIGMGNKFEKGLEALRVLSDKDSPHKIEAVFNLIEVGTATGLFCTSLGTYGLSSQVATFFSTGLAVTNCLSGLLASFYPATLTPLEQLQREIKILLENDFKLLNKENIQQFQLGLPRSRENFRQFETFHQNVNQLCMYIASAPTQEAVLNSLNRYIELRASLDMLQPTELHASAEKLHERSAALLQELTD